MAEENGGKGQSRDEYSGMTAEEKSEYLEGKLDVVKRACMEKERIWRKENESIREERIRTGEREDAMKKEIARLREELREEKAENKMNKRMKGERYSLEARPTLSQEAAKENSSISQMIASKIGAEKNESSLSQLGRSALSLHTSSNDGASALPIEWILSHFKGEIVFGLTGLSPGKLKVFGRFFKREFDSLYNKREVLMGIEAVGKNTKHLIKCLLYLSDRPEVISHLLPYVFMKHIVPDGRLYIKEIVHILYKVGITSFLFSADTIEDVKTFFNECKESKELLFLVESLAKRSPRGISRLISEEYMVSISKTHKETAARIIRLLSGCGAYSGPSEAFIALHEPPGASPYESPNGELSFFL
ncbi:hypothetical protein NEMIN01_1498 [Nematocida minor]|uniref:uncharacterized protein n=1 Tax=Nematocida minor TaxID=1912983 RepID=UPI0022205EEE|nr:uncharacterized protein NEMIN01_1498 [Nematocida minor]KAI5191422.1 hypothetical protein NEMIN01_1498 [Nematocida minor]